MRAFVFGGGDVCVSKIEEKVTSDDIVVCADSGYKNAVEMGARVDVLIGDFDSIGRVPDDVQEVLQVPPQKDRTDTQLAVEIAIERGADEIILVVSTSGRVDHTLSVLAILEDLWKRRIHAYAVNGQNRVRYIKDSGTIIVRSQYKYFSVIALDAKVKGVSIEGGKYSLVKKDILRSVQFTVSNEIEKNAALINVKKGAVYVIESVDA